jgi:hypothetical protein
MSPRRPPTTAPTVVAKGALPGTYYLKYTLPAVVPQTHLKWQRGCVPAIRTVVVTVAANNMTAAAIGNNANGVGGGIGGVQGNRVSGGGSGQVSGLPSYFLLFFQLKSVLLKQSPRTDYRIAKLCRQHDIHTCGKEALADVDRRLGVLAMIAKQQFLLRTP